jgi:integral membrane sensor domain MASE1
MKVNEGTTDKVIRIVVGLAIIIVVGFVMKSWWGIIGILPLATGLASRCPMYSILGVNTCKKTDITKSQIQLAKNNYSGRI